MGTYLVHLEHKITKKGNLGQIFHIQCQEITFLEGFFCIPCAKCRIELNYKNNEVLQMSHNGVSKKSLDMLYI